MANWNKIFEMTRWTILAGVAVALFVFTVHYLRLPEVPASHEDGPVVVREWSDSLPTATKNWQVFHRMSNSTPDSHSPITERFRFAGSFLTYGDAHSSSVRKRQAVIEDLQRQTQLLVTEQSMIDDVQVLQILRDRIILMVNGQTEELRLSFTGANNKNVLADSGTDRSSEAGQLDGSAMMGNRVGTNRWVFKRTELMNYYNELLDDPERLAAIFASLKPTRNASGKITGYNLDQEGEEDFFAAVGLKQNDVVRKVNSMNMTSRGRAEYFIREFVQDRVSAVVMDIERDGEPQKLIYLLR